MSGTQPLVVLVGPPSSGKTTVGSALAAALGVPFRDTDHDVAAETGTSIADLFVTEGEPHFRALEERAVARALAEHDGVLALGGGAVTSAATRRLLVEHAKRVGLSRDRPILGVNPRAMLRHMLETRAPLYGEVATLTVHTGKRGPADVVAEVLAAIPGRTVAP
jgi:shikimate kinase